MNGWLNIYKPLGVSSAKIVSIVKKSLSGDKVGHCGTLDVEAEGILPLAIGEATKLVRVLMDAKKTYIFTVKFGAKTDSADASGQIIATTNHIPSPEECRNICSQFLGSIRQIPPKFSALKISGVRAYKLARQNSDFKLEARNIQIYDIQYLGFDNKNNAARYSVQCSKGTYIRSLAEDIALSLQSLGFVIELCRTEVGQFCVSNSLLLEEFVQLPQTELQRIFEANSLKIEAVLDDILVFDASIDQATKIKNGVESVFDDAHDTDFCWIRYQNKLLSIGSIKNSCFKSCRVFNL